MPKPQKVTIRTVAADAGVSVTAVSNVLRNAYGVSDGMRDKVLQSIEKFGYRPSTAARGMRGRTYMVGVLLNDIVNPFLSEVVTGVQQAFEPTPFKLILGVGKGESRLESSLIETVIDNRIDGLILVSPHLDPAQQDRFTRQIPMVLLGHHEPGAATFDTVNTDDVDGARRAVHALYDAGHRNIRMLTLPDDGLSDFDVSRQREAGFRRGMDEVGLGHEPALIPCFLRTGLVDGVETTMPDSLRALLGSIGKPVAFFCWSDLHAVHLTDQARALGLRVPEDVAVIGFDNSPAAALQSIQLSSFDQGGAVLGRQAGQLLLERIKGRTEPRHLLIPPSLIRRRSY